MLRKNQTFVIFVVIHAAACLAAGKCLFSKCQVRELTMFTNCSENYRYLGIILTVNFKQAHNAQKIYNIYMCVCVYCVQPYETNLSNALED